MLWGCSSELEDPDLLSFYDMFVLDQAIIFPESDIYAGGNIIDGTFYDDSLFVFVDFFRRGIYYLNTLTTEITQIGTYGGGPGEYRHPAHVMVNQSGEIYFSDVTNSSISEITIEGEYLNRIDHTEGGGKKFTVVKDGIFVQGSLVYNLLKVSKHGDIQEKLFPIDPEYIELYTRIRGGGIFAHNGKIYFMNSIDPYIYSYDIENNNQDYLYPAPWAEIPFEMSRKGRAIHFKGHTTIDFNNIIINGKLVFVVFKERRDHREIQLIDESGNLMLQYATEKFFIGSQSDRLFFISTDRGNDDFTVTLYIYKVTVVSGKRYLIILQLLLE